MTVFAHGIKGRTISRTPWSVTTEYGTLPTLSLASRSFKSPAPYSSVATWP